MDEKLADVSEEKVHVIEKDIDDGDKEKEKGSENSEAIDKAIENEIDPNEKQNKDGDENPAKNDDNQTKYVVKKTEEVTSQPQEEIVQKAEFTKINDSKKSLEEDKSENNGAHIRINEILPNPDGTDSGNEFIEIYNSGDEEISLKSWKLYDKTNKPYVFDDFVIESKDFLTLYNKKDFSFSLNNSNEEIFLEDDEGNIISQYIYEKSISGLSWNYAENEWYPETPTPGKKNNENPLTKTYPNIIINEIFPDPESDEDKNEFIELYNPNDEEISLKNWILKDASLSGKYIIDDIIIFPKSYLTFYRSKFSFALNNSGNETVSLIAPNNNTISSVSYTDSRKSRSLNYAADQWYWEKTTPDAKNEDNPLTKTYPQLSLSEILPNPSGDENTDEFIEIYNPHDRSINLEGWTLKDASTSGSYTFMNTLSIEPHTYFVIYRSDFSFALNNGDETVSLIAPNEKVMDTLTYKSSAEDVSYNHNQDTDEWRKSKHLTPGKENVFNNLPTITKFDIDDNIYKDVYAEFETDATDKDKEKIDVRWDFGDGHKSYLWETRHKYEETGTYHGELRIQDESEEIIENFTIEVKKYPKYDIVITKIVPNPAGKDTGNEYLVIKNKSDEKINLKNWSIATGAKSKTLTNHPIYDDLYIKPGKTKVIKKKHTAISLPNKKGVIEIRRPNGSVSDKEKYGDKNISIPENASYEKIDGKWQWIIPIDKEKQRVISAIIAQALENEKMFSQQLLEQEIAYNSIYNPKEFNESKDSTKSNSSHNLFLSINRLINHLITFAQDHIKIVRAETSENFEIYKIKKNVDPCDNLHIPTSKNYTFCQK